ncbi:MAG: hypothetical protein EZS28_032257 [Streblomastix strix]|uniref:Uncharacterized protein n=1 Tax=Streblomastix strix TaxID=222440 RepID=A0A5J4UNC9_9EUKA|nr:MAG: hypothetical protein EZS28_032257 [Streblomastix strix]
MIFEWGFVKALIDSFGLGGGSEEQDNEIIQDIDEEFELEGGNDEIECHLYSSEDIYIRSQALQAKHAILNFGIDMSNYQAPGDYD